MTNEPAPEPTIPLQLLSNAARELADAHDSLVAAARAAHAEGHSWREIGSTLGVTRQAAWERFREVGNNSEDRVDE